MCTQKPIIYNQKYPLKKKKIIENRYILRVYKYIQSPFFQKKKKKKKRKSTIEIII